MTSSDKEFLEYVYSFYGIGGIYHKETPLTKQQIKAGIAVRKASGKYAADSVDREAIRDYYHI